MRDTLTTLIGKAVRAVSKLRGGGSALPGLIAERIDRTYMARVLTRLPHGVVVVSGTNGKTSTTKMIAQMLEAAGMRVFTNQSGSNFSRGVVSEILAECSVNGRLDADIAVLELDEAHAMHFIEQVPPKAALLLNVFTDQVERFSDVGVTSALLQRIADATTHVVVLNADDPFVSRINTTGRQTHAFGLAPALSDLFPRADQGSARVNEQLEPVTANVVLEALTRDQLTLNIDATSVVAERNIPGVHNAVNAAAAVALVRAVMANHGGSVDPEKLGEGLSSVKPAFGRGDRVQIRGDWVELMMVKNPAGLRLSLMELDREAAHMLAINNEISDGVDATWLESVDLSPLQPGIHTVSGTQAVYATDVLARGGVTVARTEPDIERAFQEFLRSTQGTPKQVFASYTAIMQLRPFLDAHR